MPARTTAALAAFCVLFGLTDAAPAALNFSDSFDSYAAGDLSTTGSANYLATSSSFTVTAAVGLNGTQGVTSADNSNNRQAVYKSAAGALSDGPVTLGAFFTPTTVGGSNRLFEMALYPDNVTSPTSQIRTGARVIFDGGTDRFQTIVDSAGGSSDNLPVDLVAGNWYYLQVTIASASPTTVNITTQLSNATASGTIGSLIDSASFTNLTSVIAGDGQVYAGFRSSFGGTVDNFSSVVPEPAAAVTLGLFAAALGLRRRRA